jgi:outer membrane protein W
MRRLLLLVTVVAMSTVVQADDRWRISVLASEISSTSDSAGVGLAAAYAFRENWDVEVTAASRNYIAPYTQFVTVFTMNPDPRVDIIPMTVFRRYKVNPVDLMMTRHFLSSQRVAPYVRAGVRYVDAPDDPEPFTTQTVTYGFEPVREGFGFSDRTSLQAGAGVRVRLTDNTALRADVTRALRAKDAPYDALTRGALGVSWRF